MNKAKHLLFIIIPILLTQSIYSQEKIPLPPVPPVIADEVLSYFELTEKEELAYLKNLDAELKLRLQEIKENDKEKYAEYLRELYWKQMKGAYRLRGREKKLYEIEKQIIEYEIMSESLALKFKKASASGKEKIREDLKKYVSTLFDQKEQRRQWEVDMLEEQLAELKTKIAGRQKNKEVIVRRRLEELLDEEEELEWE